MDVILIFCFFQLRNGGSEVYIYTGDKVCRRNSLQLQILPTPESLTHRARYCLPVTGSARGGSAQKDKELGLELLGREGAAKSGGLRKLWASPGVLSAGPG